jgi:glutathione S-transferase
MHKDIVGARCFQRIAVDVEFDARLRVLDQHIKGGRWLTAEEYQAATT